MVLTSFTGPALFDSGLMYDFDATFELDPGSPDTSVTAELRDSTGAAQAHPAPAPSPRRVRREVREGDHQGPSGQKGVLMNAKIAVGFATILGTIGAVATILIPMIGELADAVNPLGVPSQTWVIISAVLTGVTVLGRMAQAVAAVVKQPPA